MDGVLIQSVPQLALIQLNLSLQVQYSNNQIVTGYSSDKDKFWYFRCIETKII